MAHAPSPPFLENPMVNPGQVKGSGASEGHLLKRHPMWRMSLSSSFLSRMSLNEWHQASLHRVEIA